MLIITADDYGKSAHATESILKCFLHKRITSTSVMVFMEDSVRAAALAVNTGLELGLHLNFTEPFSAGNTPRELCAHQERVIAYLSGNKLAQALYNPLLAESFRFLYQKQHDEFVRLYGKLPDFINGHHHMHLCANVLAGNIIPKWSRVRRTFTFAPGEKSFLNRMYRRILDFQISRRFISTERFFSIEPIHDQERLARIIGFAAKEAIEIEVHPENAEEMEFLLSEQFNCLIDSVHCGRFLDLSN